MKSTYIMDKWELWHFAINKKGADYSYKKLVRKFTQLLYFQDKLKADNFIQNYAKLQKVIISSTNLEQLRWSC